MIVALLWKYHIWTSNWGDNGWKSGVSGFQIKYARNRKFTKKKKSKNVGKYVQDKTIRGLKKGKTYFVRIRAYKKVSGKKIYGKWSKIKKAKMK